MGVIDKLVVFLPSHPHTPKLKKVPTALPQFTGVPVHLPPFWPSHGPAGLYNGCKGSETDGRHKGSQTSPMPSRMADQVPTSGGRTSEHPDCGRPDTVLGVDNQSREVQTQTHSGVFVCGLRIPPRFSPYKTHSRQMAQTSGFYPKLHALTAKCLMLLIGLLPSTGNMVPERRLHMRLFQFRPTANDYPLRYRRIQKIRQSS